MWPSGGSLLRYRTITEVGRDTEPKGVVDQGWNGKLIEMSSEEVQFEVTVVRYFIACCYPVSVSPSDRSGCCSVGEVIFAVSGLLGPLSRSI